MTPGTPAVRRASAWIAVVVLAAACAVCALLGWELQWLTYRSACLDAAVQDGLCGSFGRLGAAHYAVLGLPSAACVFTVVCLSPTLWLRRSRRADGARTGMPFGLASFLAWALSCSGVLLVTQIVSAGALPSLAAVGVVTAAAVVLSTWGRSPEVTARVLAVCSMCAVIAGAGWFASGRTSPAGYSTAVAAVTAATGIAVLGPVLGWAAPRSRS